MKFNFSVINNGLENCFVNARFKQTVRGGRLHGSFLSNRDEFYADYNLFYTGTASLKNPQCKVLYERIVAKGKSKKLALIAVTNKLLKQAFAVAKSDVRYNPDYKPVFAPI